MKVEVTYHAQIRVAAGGAAGSVEVAPGTTVLALLRIQAERHGEAFRKIVLDDAGRVRPGIIVLINDRPKADSADPVLAEGDRIALFSPVAGG